MGILTSKLQEGKEKAKTWNRKRFIQPENHSQEKDTLARYPYSRPRKIHFLSNRKPIRIHDFCAAAFFPLPDMSSKRVFPFEDRELDVYAVLYVYSGALTVRCRNKFFSRGRGHEVIFLHLNEPMEIKQEEGKAGHPHLSCRGYLSMAYQILYAGGMEPIAVRSREEWDGLISKIQYYMQYPTNLNHILLVHVMSRAFFHLISG